MKGGAQDGEADSKKGSPRWIPATRVGANQPECGGDRHWVRRALRGGTAGQRSRWAGRAVLPSVHLQLGGADELAAKVRRHVGGDGVDRGVLDSTVRPVGEQRTRGQARGPSGTQAGAREGDRCTG